MESVRVRRFLLLGAETGPYRGGGSYDEDAPATTAAARDEGGRLVELVLAVLAEGRFPRRDPAVHALALVFAGADETGRRAAADALTTVCATGRDLLGFVARVDSLRGWGRGLRRAVGRWYLERDVDALALAVVTHREEQGWTHRDVLRLAHPRSDEPARRALFAWITRGCVSVDLPAAARAWAVAAAVDDTAAWAALVAEVPCGPAALPAWALRRAEVWEALLGAGLPHTVVLDHLRWLTDLGVLTGTTLGAVVAQLSAPDWPREQGVHPLDVLVARQRYVAAPVFRDRREPPWQEPIGDVVDALTTAYDAAFHGLEAAGTRTLVALDVSGSMGRHALEQAVTIALALLVAEPVCDIVAYAGASTRAAARGPLDRGWMVPLPIGLGWSLDEAVRAIDGLPFAPVDYSRPMTWALDHGREFDTFVIVTDDETCAGSRPEPALGRYRAETGIPARLVVIRLGRSWVPIPHAADMSVLDVDGWDAHVPRLVVDFARGR